MNRVWTGIVAFALLIVTAFLIYDPQLTGRTFSATAEPGSIRVVTVESLAQLWQAYIGEVGSIPGPQQVNATGGGVDNISLQASCTPSTIMFSPTTFINTASFVAVPTSAIDAYMNVNASHTQSATNTFNETRSFTIGSVTLTTIAARTRASHDDFYVGVVNSSSGYVFLASVSVQKENFRGGQYSDFQAMVPLFMATTTAYYPLAEPSCEQIEQEDKPPIKERTPYIRSYNDTEEEPTIIRIPSQEPEQPQLPALKPPIPPLQIEVKTSIEGNEYVIEINIPNLDEEFTVDDLDILGEAGKYFRLRDRIHLFLPNKTTKIYLVPIGDVVPGKYSGVLRMRHNRFGELNIPFEIGIPERTAFNISYLLILLMILLLLILIYTVSHHKEEKRKKQDTVDRALEIMREQMKKLGR